MQPEQVAFKNGEKILPQEQNTTLTSELQERKIDDFYVKTTIKWLAYTHTNIHNTTPHYTTHTHTHIHTTHTTPHTHTHRHIPHTPHHTHTHTDQIYEAGTYVIPRGHSSTVGRLKYIFCDFLN